MTTFNVNMPKIAQGLNISVFIVFFNHVKVCLKVKLILNKYSKEKEKKELKYKK